MQSNISVHITTDQKSDGGHWVRKTDGLYMKNILMSVVIRLHNRCFILYSYFYIQ